MAKKYLQHTAQQIDDAVTQLSELSQKVGDLSELDESVADSSLVGAINKAAQQGGGGLTPEEKANIGKIPTIEANQTTVNEIKEVMQQLPDGSAVSAQVAINTQKLSELDSKLNIQGYDVGDFVQDYVLLKVLEANQNSIGSTIDLTNILGNGSYCYSILDVKAGEKYTISYDETATLANTKLVILDSANVAKRVFNSPVNLLPQGSIDITIEDGESKLAFNTVVRANPKITTEKSLVPVVSEIGKEVDALSLKDKLSIDTIPSFAFTVDTKINNTNYSWGCKWNGKNILVIFSNVLARSDYSTVLIYIDGENVYSLSETNNVRPSACALLGDELYFIGSMDANSYDGGANTDTTLRLYKYSLINNTWREVGSPVTMTGRGGASIATWISACEVNGTIYFVTSDDNFSATQYIRLYKVDGEQIVYVNDVATVNDIWGGYGNSATSYSYKASFACMATLGFDEEGNLYCLYYGDGNYHRPLIKKYSGSTWEHYTIPACGLKRRDAYIWHQNFITKITKDIVIQPADKGLSAYINDSANFCGMSMDSFCKYLIGRDDVQISGCFTNRVGDTISFIVGYCTGSAATKDTRYSAAMFTISAKVFENFMRGEYSTLVSGSNPTVIPFNTHVEIEHSGKEILNRYINDGNWKSFYRTLGKGEKVTLTNLGYESFYVNTKVKPTGTTYNKVFSAGFDANDWQCFWFRCPNVVQCVDGTIIATGNALYASTSDNAPISVAFAKSYDKGYTWKPMHVLDTEYLSFGRYSCTLAIDTNIKSAHYGRVWLLGMYINTSDNSNYMADETTRIFTMYSDDNGESWSEKNDITDSLFPTREGIKRFVITIANGITIKGGACNGAIVFPTWSDYGTTSGVYNLYSNIVYSLDGGTTWKLSKDAPLKGGNEDAVVQWDNNTLILSIRGLISQGGARKFYKMDISSGNMNGDWTEFDGYEESPLDCQEGLVKIGNVYLNSRPKSGNREYLSLFASRDLKNWVEVAEITGKIPNGTPVGSGLNGYSNIIVGDGTLGVIYEDKFFNIVYCNLDSSLPIAMSV